MMAQGDYMTDNNRIRSSPLDIRFDRGRHWQAKIGFVVLDIQGLNITNDADMVKVTPDFIKEFALSIDRQDAEAIFISCGALRSIDVVDEIEEIVRKPVIVSNQAMIWETLRLADIYDVIDGHGSLLRKF
jgi:maleate isomerase